jgi:hypothetical protein
MQSVPLLDCAGRRRLRGVIGAGLRISEALALSETDLNPQRGAIPPPPGFKAIAAARFGVWDCQPLNRQIGSSAISLRRSLVDEPASAPRGSGGR